MKGIGYRSNKIIDWGIKHRTISIKGRDPSAVSVHYKGLTESRVEEGSELRMNLEVQASGPCREVTNSSHRLIALSNRMAADWVSLTWTNANRLNDMEMTCCQWSVGSFHACW